MPVISIKELLPYVHLLSISVCLYPFDSSLKTARKSCATFHLLFLRSGWESTSSLLKDEQRVTPLMELVHHHIYSWWYIQGQPLGPSLWASKQQHCAPDGACSGCFLSVLFSTLYSLAIPDKVLTASLHVDSRQNSLLSPHLHSSAPSSAACTFCPPSVLHAHEKPSRHKAKWATEASAGGLGAGLTGPRRVAAVEAQWWHTDNSGGCIHKTVLWHCQGWGRWNLNWNLEGAPSENFSLPSLLLPRSLPKPQVFRCIFLEEISH